MTVRTPHRASAGPVGPPPEPALDVLDSGTEPWPWAERRLAGRVLLGLALVVGAALLAGQGQPQPERTADRVGFSLHPGSVVVPRHVPPAPGRAAVARLNVEVVNTGETAVRLRSASLVPGRWRVEVASRRELRAGWSVVLDLHREVDCARGADVGPVPRQLELAVEVDGRVMVRTVDVGPEQVAYGGRIDDVLRSPRDACDPDAALPLPGPIGDLFPPRAPGG